MRRISIALVLILLLSVMAGCSGTSSDEVSRAVPQITQSAEEKETAAETEKASSSGIVSDALATELFTDDDAFPINLDEQKDAVNITAPGNYVLTGTLKGQIVVNTAEEGKVKLILNGADICCENDACIYVKKADKVVVSSNEGSINNLNTTGEFAQSDENKADAVIFSQEDLNLNGDGVINIVSAYGHGVVTKDKLKVKDGEVNIVACKKGLSGKDALEIEGGTVNIESRTHSVYSEGDITISGGEINISSSKKDAIHTTENVNITGGTVNILNCIEGIEGLTVTISGGNVSIVSSDDGINSSSGQSSEGGKGIIGGNPFIADDGADITISGGIITINAGGDGIDSNGTLHMSGGELYITGPTISADGAIDYATEAIISGGSVVATGAAGMAEGFGTNSTQCNILYNCNTTYDGGTDVSLFDSDGNVLISFTPEKSFSSVVVSCPEMKIGETYTLVIGEDSAEIEMTSVCYSTGGHGMDMMPSGGMGFGPGGGPGGHGGPGGPGGNKPVGDRPQGGFNPGQEPPGEFGAGPGGPGGRPQGE